MPILFEMSHRDSFHKSLNQNRVSCKFFKSLREIDKLIIIEVSVEYLEIVFFDVEVNLVY